MTSHSHEVRSGKRSRERKNKMDGVQKVGSGGRSILKSLIELFIFTRVRDTTYNDQPNRTLNVRPTKAASKSCRYDRRRLPRGSQTFAVFAGYRRGSRHVIVQTHEE